MPPAQKLEEHPNFPTAVVAGGAGFIGSHLCERLLSHDVEVICVDNLSTGKKQNLKKLKKHPRFYFLPLNLSTTPLKRITRANYVFHLIDTQQHSTTSQDNLENLLAGTHATKHLLELTQKFKAKFLLASTVNVYQAFLSTKSLNDYFGPTTQQENFYSLAEAKRIAESITAEFYKTKNTNSRLVRLLDVYGPRMDLYSQNTLARFLLSLKLGEPLKVIGDGLQKLYPTYITDVIEGLMAAMFTAATNGEIFTLANPNSITEINLAYLLRELVPHRQEIDFIPQPNQLPQTNPAFFDSSQSLHWKPQVLLEEGLGQTLQWLSHLSQDKIASSRPTRLKPLKSTRAKPDKTPTTSLPPTPKTHQAKFTLKIFKRLFSQKSAKPKKKKPPLTFKKTLIVAIALLILSLSFPFISLAATSFIAVNSLKNTQTNLDSGKLTAAIASAQKAQRHFSASKQTLATLNRLVVFESLKNYLFRLEKLLELGLSVSEASLHLAQAADSFLTASQIIIGNDIGNTSDLINHSRAEITRSYELLSLASAEIQANRPKLKKVSLAGIGSRYQELEDHIPKLRQTVETARDFLTFLPDIIGLGGKKKVYLMLLQNNAELRPTGGFIGSFALVTFENGQLLDFVIEDVYTADGKLKGHVEPPVALKQHLGEATWYLRDVNWNPDFPTTARQAEWFLQKELGRSVDGTIAVNLYVAQYLLDALKEVSLSDYGETITSANLFERAEFHSEVDFFPGSTQKKDFLSSLARSLYTSLQTLEPNESLPLARAVERSLTQGQLLISLKDKAVAQKLKELGWDGSLTHPTCHTNNQCYQDYLAIREANVGVNKANFFVKRKIDHSLRIFKEDNLTATTNIYYTNDSPAEAWPGGTYKNYLRLYLPLGSQVKSVHLNQKQLATDQIDLETLNDKTVVGFLVTVPIKSQTSVKVVYRLPGEIAFKRGQSTSEYSLLVQKQSGTNSDPFTFNLSFPAYLKPIITIPQTDIADQSISFSTNLSQDRSFSVDFAK